MEKRKARILLYDLEISRDLVEGYGSKYEFRVVKTIRHQELMCFSYKWLDEKKIHHVSRHDFLDYKEAVKDLNRVMGEADICIAHNGARFDNKVANRFFIKEGLSPVPPYKTIDTLQIARREFKFQSNSLNDLCDYLEIGNKSKITYADLETDYMTDKPAQKTLDLMKKYNNMDITLLEKLYIKLRPFTKNHVNLGMLTQQQGVCAKCGKGGTFESRGTKVRANGLVRQFWCKPAKGGCGGWNSERVVDKDSRTLVEDRPDIVNAT